MFRLDVVVCILFHERLAQTIECVRSFLSANVPIVVLNNGSSAESRDEFAAWSAGHAQVRLLEVPDNLGVGGGRNLLIQATTEEWLLFVDNDIVMNTSQWLEHLYNHAAGNVEVIIPRLYNHHDGCYADYRRIKISGKTAHFTSAENNHVNSFPGGASLINRNLFHRLGGYDEQLFVGIEDFELSLRGILAGEPIRALLVSDVELTHNHLMECATDDDVKAVLGRYDKEVIGKSYERVREKHGIAFEDGWESWVDQQVISVKKMSQLNGAGSNSKNEAIGRPRIALVADSRDWAFGNISRQIEARLSVKYELRIYFTDDYHGDFDALLSDLYGNNHELVHYFWRGAILNLYMHILRTRHCRADSILETFIDTKLSFSVYDHCLLNNVDLLNYQVVFKYLAEEYVVSSERLLRIYGKISDYPDPYRIIEDGVDLSKFRPRNNLRLFDNQRSIVVGWAGNSQWGNDIDGFDYKGFNTIIKPAIALLKQEGFDVVGKFADRNVDHIPYESMVDYYNSIDIYVCASSMEGTPNPILEAMACGVPVISTDVGIVPQLFGPEQKQYILPGRSIHALKEKLITLINSPDQRMKLSRENVEQIKGWTRELEIRKWDDFFSHTLNQNSQQKQLLKRACLEVPYNYGIEATIDRFLEDSLSWRLTRPLRLFRWHAVRLKNHLKLKLRAGNMP